MCFGRLPKDAGPVRYCRRELNSIALNSSNTRRCANKSVKEPAVVALAWLLQNPAVTAPIIGPRTKAQLTVSLRALEISLSTETNRRLDEIWPGPGGEAPQAYAW